MSAFRLLVGDALEQLRTLPDESVQTCVTSPPYWGLLDRGSDERHVEIVLDSTAAKSAAPLFSGRITRWRPQFEAMVRLGSKRGKVTVYVDGVEVDAATLKVNEVIP